MIGSGIARGAAERGRRIAFGDKKRIIWDKNSQAVFAGNPDIAPPGSEGARDIEWVPFFRGSRIYNRLGDGRWIWNYEFCVKPGRMVFTKAEHFAGQRLGRGWVLIEPNVLRAKPVAANKTWERARYQGVADGLRAAGHRVVQFRYGSDPTLAGVETISTASFREAVALLANAALYIGPEGGLHHAAAAVGVPAVVLFGGFVPPAVTGYDTHTNLTGGAEACGSLRPCDHCRRAMAAITADEVLAAATGYLSKEAL